MRSLAGRPRRVNELRYSALGRGDAARHHDSAVDATPPQSVPPHERSSPPNRPPDPLWTSRARAPLAARPAGCFIHGPLFAPLLAALPELPRPDRPELLPASLLGPVSRAPRLAARASAARPGSAPGA